tara:strand:+ start:247 stop:534 length:288 start_codon:yes stop_codon:yes gene_type:complete
MIEKVTNNVSSLDSKTNKNASKPSVAETVVNVEVNDGVSDSIKANKKAISELASSPPIDFDKVSKIKKAISAGEYPLDLDKISDALMQAYREMKS